MHSPSFRLGSTSYVYPANLLTNVRHLVKVVQDIELVLFELPSGESNFGELADAVEMATIARAHHCTFTVHLPLDLYGGRDTHAFQMAERVIDLTAPLTPYGYVFHIEHRAVGTAEWYEAGHAAIEALLRIVPDPQCLCLENLESYAPEVLEPFFATYPIARALDIGHLWKAGLAPLPYLQQWLPTTRVIHWHGATHDGTQMSDHQSLAVMESEKVREILEALHGYTGVLTLEVFEGDFWSSYETIRGLGVKFP